jgi:hypothetical protein
MTDATSDDLEPQAYAAGAVEDDTVEELPLPEPMDDEDFSPYGYDPDREPGEITLAELAADPGVHS